MSSFTEITDWYEPVLIKQKFWKPPQFKVTKQLEWEVGIKGSGHKEVVPRGFTFNVSIPFVLWWALSPSNPKFLKA